MKKRFIIFLKFVTPFLLIVGFACSFIKWGEPDQLHGKGFPIPTVMWDHASRYSDDPTIPDDQFLDFVNPSALILNPLLFFLTGLMIFFSLEFGLKLLQTIRKTQAT